MRNTVQLHPLTTSMAVGGLLISLAVLYSLIWTCCAFQHVSFTIQVRAKRRECFYKNLSPGDRIRMDWQVIKGGNLDIDFFFTEPDYTMRVVELRSHGGGAFVNIGEHGEYEFCLDNRFSKMTDKFVFFSVDVKTREQKDSEVRPSPFTEANLTAEVAAERLVGISESLHKVFLQQEFFRAQESRHRYLLEGNNSRVLWWSVLECAVMVVASVVQVMVVRSLFRTRRKDRIQT